LQAGRVRGDLAEADAGGDAGGGLRRAARLASRWASAAAARISAWRARAAAFFAGLGTSRPGSSGVAAWHQARQRRAAGVRDAEIARGLRVNLSRSKIGFSW